MIIGDEKIDKTIAAMRATLENDADVAELAEVDEVFLVVALHYGPADEVESAEVGQVFYRCTSARPHVQYGLLTQARRAIDRELDGGGL